MVAIANLQYAWTLFVPEIQKTHGWSRAGIQTAFTIYIVVQTWLTPIEGIFLDRYGPRLMILLGGLCVGASWLIDSFAQSLTGFYIGAVIGGIGGGVVYVAAANVAVAWFADRRGLAAGIVGAGFGAGSALTIIPIANMIKTSGYQSAFFWFAFIIGGCILLAGAVMRAPKPGEAPLAVLPTQSRKNYTLGEALRMPAFYTLFLILTLVLTGGLMAVAQLSLIAQDLGIADAPINLYFFTMAALPMALLLDRVVNGLSRWLIGWVSDYLGRENTMFVAFLFEGLGILALGAFGSNPWVFLLMTGVVFFAWGEIYSLASAITADTFGTKHYGKIYGLLYCSKGVGALLVPFGNVLMHNGGSWMTILGIVAVMNFIAAFAALFLLKPMLRRHREKFAVEPEAEMTGAPV
jgi:oxalate/formate antiporter